MLLAEIAFGRSGDKGDICNVGLMAKSPDLYPALRASVTPERVKAHYGDMVRGEVVVYELANLKALNVVMRGALGGGATRTIRLDQTGKSMCTALLRMPVVTEG